MQICPTTLLIKKKKQEYIIVSLENSFVWNQPSTDRGNDLVKRLN